MTRWAIVGASGFAEETCVPTLLDAPEAELIGCCGSSPASGRRIAETYGLRKSFDAFEELVADLDVDAVWIASPTGLHADHAIGLMRAGKSVLIEKPLALTLADAELVRHAADQTGTKAAIGFHQRFKTAHVRAREAIGAGLLGRLAYVRCHCMIAYDSAPGAWRQVAETAGGGWSINDLGTHLLDTVRFVTQSDVVAAKALFGHVRFGFETDDTFAGVLKLRNGALGSLEASTAVASPGSRLELVGDAGSMIIDGSFMNTSSTTVVNGAAPQAADESGAYRTQIAGFHALLNGQSSDIATLVDGVANVRWTGEMIGS